MEDKKKKTMKENYNAVHNLCEQYAGLNALRDIFSEAQEAEKIIASKDHEVKHREELIVHLEIAKEKLKDEIGTEYKKFKEKQKAGYDALDKDWKDHQFRVAKDKEEKLGILESAVKDILLKSKAVQSKLELGKIHLKKLEDRIQVREAQLGVIDEQINKLREATAK